MEQCPQHDARMRVCENLFISIDQHLRGARRCAHRTHDGVVLDEAEGQLGNLVTKGKCLRCIFPPLLLQLLLQLRKVLPVARQLSAGTATRGPKRTLTSDSCGNRVTKAMNNSQPAFRLMGLGDLRFSSSAPSFNAWTSSNIVPASNCRHRCREAGCKEHCTHHLT